MKKQTETHYQERIIKVLLYIQQHLHEELSLEKLSSIASFSPYHFHRIFRGMIGESLAEHVRRLRLERSAAELMQTQKSITDIAFDCGYETVESYTRAFRKNFKSSPSEYRKENHADVYKKVHDISLSLDFKKGNIKMDVKIVNQNEINVAFVRHIGPYAECGSAWEKLCSWAGPKGLLRETTQFIGLCYDDPEVTPKDKIRYDASIEVESNIEAQGEIGIQSVEAGTYAITIHKGTYDKLKDTYANLCGQWLPENGKEIKNAPSMEIYLNDPKTTKEEDLLTEIRIPLS